MSGRLWGVRGGRDRRAMCVQALWLCWAWSIAKEAVGYDVIVKLKLGQC